VKEHLACHPKTRDAQDHTDIGVANKE